VVAEAAKPNFLIDFQRMLQNTVVVAKFSGAGV